MEHENPKSENTLQLPSYLRRAKPRDDQCIETLDSKIIRDLVSEKYRMTHSDLRIGLAFDKNYGYLNKVCKLKNMTFQIWYNGKTGNLKL